MSARSMPKVPAVPTLIPTEWKPPANIHEELQREYTAEAINDLVKKFISFCREHRLERVAWATTFRTWVKKGSTSTWLPKSSW